MTETDTMLTFLYKTFEKLMHVHEEISGVAAINCQLGMSMDLRSSSEGSNPKNPVMDPQL